jgi:hypothetical protein
VAGISAPIHEDDNALEIRFCGFQHGLVCGASHANPEVKSTRPRKRSLGQKITHMLSEHNVLKLERVRVKVVCLDFPKYTRDNL